VLERYPAANLSDRLIRHRVHESSIMGRLGDGNDRQGYDERFDRIARTLILRQARRLFDAATLSDDEAQLLPSLILGLPARDLEAFLRIFESLLGEFQRRYSGTSTADFRLTLARQYDALAMRVTPSSRRATLRVFQHGSRLHPEIRAYLSWPRMLSLVLFGKKGRDRVGAWSRRFIAGSID
jgi:hypothetical protein